MSPSINDNNPQKLASSTGTGTGPVEGSSAAEMVIAQIQSAAEDLVRLTTDIEGLIKELEQSGQSGPGLASIDKQNKIFRQSIEDILALIISGATIDTDEDLRDYIEKVKQFNLLKKEYSNLEKYIKDRSEEEDQEAFEKGAIHLLDEAVTGSKIIRQSLLGRIKVRRPPPRPIGP